MSGNGSDVKTQLIKTKLSFQRLCEFPDVGHQTASQGVRAAGLSEDCRKQQRDRLRTPVLEPQWAVMANLKEGEGCYTPEAGATSSAPATGTSAKEEKEGVAR